MLFELLVKNAGYEDISPTDTVITDVDIAEGDTFVLSYDNYLFIDRPSAPYRPSIIISYYRGAWDLHARLLKGATFDKDVMVHAHMTRQFIITDLSKIKTKPPMQVRIVEDLEDGKLRVRMDGEPENVTEALDNSIEKWELMLNTSLRTHRTVHSGGISTCALCNLYFMKNCRGCPIMLRTGHWECNKSPYEDYVRTSDRYDETEYDEHWDAYIDAVKNMLEFLKSLKVEEVS